jgi:hypothetical protein
VLLIRHHYPDELALGSLRLRKPAACDREIDLLLPFGAAGMRRDAPNFDGPQDKERDVANPLLPSSFAQSRVESAS